MAVEQSASLKFRVLSASALSLMDQLIKVASALVISPIMIHGLGLDGYGVWVLAVSIAGYVDLLDFGFGLAAVRFYSRAIGAGDPENLSAFFDHLRRHYNRLGNLILCASLAICAYAFATHDGGPLLSMWMIVGVLAVISGVVFRFRAHAALLKARLEYGKVIGTGLLRLLVFSSAVFAWGTHGLTIGRLLLLQAGLQLVEQLTLYAWARRLVPKGDVVHQLPPKEKSDFVRLASQYALGHLAIALRQRVDTQLLGAYTSLPIVSQYAVGVRLPTLFFDMINALFGGHLMAGLSQLAARNDLERLRTTLFKALQLSTAAAVLGGTGLAIFGPTFIDCWLGSDFGPAHQVLQALVIGMAVVAAQYPAFAFLSAVNAFGKVVTVSLVTATANFICSFVLVQKIGLMGVVWSTVGEYALQGLLFWPLLTARAAQVPIFTYYRVLGLQTAVPLLATAVPIGMAVKAYFVPQSYVDLIQCAAVMGVYAAAAIWWGILNRADRTGILAKVLRRSNA